MSDNSRPFPTFRKGEIVFATVRIAAIVNQRVVVDYTLGGKWVVADTFDGGRLVCRPSELTRRLPMLGYGRD